MKNIKKYHKIKEVFNKTREQFCFFSKILFSQNSKYTLLGVIIVIVFANAFQIIMQFLFKKILQILENNFVNVISSNTELEVIVIEYSLLFILSFFLEHYRVILYRIEEFYAVDTAKTVFISKIEKLGKKDVENSEFHTLYSFLLNSINVEPANFAMTTLNVMASGLNVIGYFICLLYSYVSIWHIFLGTIPFVIIEYNAYTELLKSIGNNKEKVKKENYCFDVLANIKNISELTFLDAYSYFNKWRRAYFRQRIQSMNKIEMKGFIYRFILLLMSVISMVYIINTLIQDLSYKRISLAKFAWSTGVLVSFFNSIKKCANMMAGNIRSQFFMKRLFEFSKLKASKMNKRMSPFRTFDECHKYTELKLKNVSFVYEKNGRQVLSDINLTFKKGEVVYIVGANGSGKTTLINLLTRVYTPTNGNILINNIDVNQYETQEFNKKISVMSQNYGKYSIPLLNFIQLGNEFSDKIKLENTLNNVGVTQFVDIKKCYECLLTKRFSNNGQEFSEGQWQKLCIARTILKEADIYFFDEPTSAQDAISEENLHRLIFDLRKKGLVIVISHRIPRIKNIRIIMLENGKIKTDSTNVHL